MHLKEPVIYQQYLKHNSLLNVENTASKHFEKQWT